MDNIVRYQARRITDELFEDDLVETALEKIKKLPGRTRDILDQADRLSRTNGEIALSEPVTSLDLLLLLAHENARFLRKIIPPRKLIFSYGQYEKQVNRFEKLYETPPPLEMLQVEHCLEQLNACLKKGVNWSYVLPDFSFEYGMNISLFSSQPLTEKSLLQGRSFEQGLGYYPIAYSVIHPKMTYGMVFDNDLMQFTTCVGLNIGTYTGTKLLSSLWGVIGDYLKAEAFDGIEIWAPSTEEVSNLCTYTKIRKHVDKATLDEYGGGIYTWLLNFILPGYLEDNQYERITFPRSLRRRYSDWHGIEQKSKNGKNIALNETFPRLVLPRVKAFSRLDAFVVQKICDVMNRFICHQSTSCLYDEDGVFGSREICFDYFREDYIKMDNSGKELLREILGEESLQAIVKSDVTNELIKGALERATEYAIRENDAGRYGWAIHFGMSFWDAWKPFHSDLSVACLEVVKRDYLHPLIPKLAKAYNETRFDDIY